MKKIFILFALALTLFVFSCTKDDEGYGVKNYYGSFSAELLALPGASTLDIYVAGTKIDTLAAGRIIGNDIPKRLTAGKATTISFKKAGTDSLVLDTTITAGASEKVALKIAYSSTLGMKSFTSGNTNVSADSTSFFLFNSVPDGAVADAIKTDAYLLKWNSESSLFEETGIVWTNLEKGKLHPNFVTVRATKDDGSAIIYAIKLKNKDTGEFLADGIGSEYFSIYIEAGKREIITLNALDLGGGLWFFLPDYAIY
ncbi:DUF4397 domain-containing protein [Pararcticibacter amylolyticus]|uniref:DUF1735 domain-containing protein n=1 Tax=Pararcticibacter amylolyticus TaxID=2173175 RepID=A0A2U2PKZ9_9SPHI|nr:DUF4397 domain-containing protein [Pararcticibacter amylolyticus]PWG81942.1 hypothetical protein DDR33_02610 [Pararcticibacter amylolyticus]